MVEKEYDVVIFGATGFTGKLVTRYFLSNPETSSDPSFRWAIAGRSDKKLQAVKAQLKTQVDDVSAKKVDDIPIIEADSSDMISITKMVKMTKVVMALVGPYASHGSWLVQACAENGVHYCDLTGEMLWAEKMIHEFEPKATETGARIVNCCGFESVPADMMTFALTDFARQERDSYCSSVSYYLTDLNMSPSGGTVHSLFNHVLHSTNEELWRILRDPYLLADADYKQNKPKANVLANQVSFVPRFQKDLYSWTTPFFTSTTDGAVVLRSNLKLHEYYGSSFVFSERMFIGGFLTSMLLTSFMYILGILSYIPWTNEIARKVAPSPGEGPSDEEMINGKMKAEAFAYDSDRNLIATGSVHCVGDVSYLVTAHMISEIALCLAKDEHDGANGSAGFLTPASACGRSLLKRLADRRMLSIEVLPVTK